MLWLQISGLWLLQKVYGVPVFVYAQVPCLSNLSYMLISQTQGQVNKSVWILLELQWHCMWNTLKGETQNSCRFTQCLVYKQRKLVVWGAALSSTQLCPLVGPKEDFPLINLSRVSITFTILAKIHLNDYIHVTSNVCNKFNLTGLNCSNHWADLSTQLAKMFLSLSTGRIPILKNPHCF